MKLPFFPVTRREAERQGIPFSSAANKNAPFPTQLRELREKRGVSQAVFAKALGVSKSTVGLWETGDTLPDAKSIRDIAEYFEVTADYLLGLSTATRGEFHDFARVTHFNVSTIGQLTFHAGSCRNDKGDKRKRLPFEYLICTNEFSGIVDLLRDYLDVFAHIRGEDHSKEYLQKYVTLDSMVDNLSNGNFHVISSALFSQSLIARAQQLLCAMFESAKQLSEKNGGWNQYMPDETRRGHNAKKDHT
ncbi:MAG: helix-turn-helix domain-containing protein [Oscillospiraceae bacterium]